MSVVVTYVMPQVAYLASDGLLLFSKDGNVTRMEGNKLIEGNIVTCGWTGMNRSEDDTTGVVTYDINAVLKECEQGSTSVSDVAQRFPAAIQAGFQRVIDKHRDDQDFRANVGDKRVGIDVALVGCQDDRIIGVRGWHDVELGQDSKPILKQGPQQYGIIAHDQNKLNERPTIMGLATWEREKLWSAFKAQYPDYQAYFSPLQRLEKLVECAIVLFPDRIGWPINTLTVTCGSRIPSIIRGPLASE